MKINNILIITVLFMSITITVSGIYFYPLYYPQLYTWAYLSLFTSMANHFTPTNIPFKIWFQHIDRIVIRITGLIYLFLTNKIDKDDILKIEKFGHEFAMDIIIYFFIFFGAMLYFLSRSIKKKNPHIPKNIIKIPHALSHILATIATVILFNEYSL